MQEFFRGWRRKSGCVTLVMACVLAAGWVRSDHKTEYLRVAGPFDSHWPFVVSDSGRIRLCFLEVAHEPILSRDEDYYDGADDRLWHSLITVEPFTIGSGRVVGGGHAIVLSYFSIVLPLTIISAYLLLSKSCKSTPITMFETTANDGATP